MTEDHAVLARLDERCQAIMRDISGVNVRLTKFEARLEHIQEDLRQLTTNGHRNGWMERGTTVAGGGGLATGIFALGRLAGWW